ncbi:hypothetical protein LCGC14_2975380, partial [marine sediment metagenome]
LMDWITERFTAEKCAARGLGTGITLYGEGFGAGIQKGGGNYGDEKTFILFDAFYKNIWMPQATVQSLAEAFDIESAPVLNHHTLTSAIALVRNGFDSAFGSFDAEGVVVRPTTELVNQYGERVIAKIKTKDFA